MGSGSRERRWLERGARTGILGTWYFRPETGEHGWDATMERRLGPPGSGRFEELGGTIDPDSAAALEAALLRVLERGGEFECEVALRRGDRLRLRGECVRNPEDGEVIVGRFVEPTPPTLEQIDREREMALLRAALEQSPEGIILVEAPTGRTRVINRAAVEILKRPADDLARFPIDYAKVPWKVHRADGTELDPRDLPLARALRGETTKDLEMHIRYPDGGGVHVLGSGAPVRDEEGQLIGGVALFPDVTERRLRDVVGRRLEEIVLAAPYFVGTTLPDQTVQFVNPFGRQLYGLGPDEDVSRLGIRDFHPEWAYRQIVEEAIPVAIAEGPWTAETSGLHRDGHEFPVLLTVVAHRDAHGKVAFFSGIMRDLTGVRELEQRLRQSQKMEAVGRLAGGIAHDFNNLLTAILGNLELAERRQGEPDANLATVRGAAQRAAELTRQLLAFARRQIVEPRLIDLNDSILQVDRMLSRLLGEDIHRTHDLQHGLGAVRIDPTQVEQILINLAINARDAMPDGGRITFRTRNVDAAEVAPAGDDGGPWVELTVSDTGRGMSAKELAHAFEPFYTTKARDRGTGLGLATCEGIVTQNGGRIDAFSEPGQGATFRILLPRVEGEPTRPRPPEIGDEAEPAPSGDETILVVEDEENVRRMVETALRAKGYTVYGAASGPEAIRLARGFPGRIDLLVTDVVLPELNGKEIADRLRATRPDLKVLFCSGYTDNAIVRRGVLREGVEFLHKPYTPSRLARRIRDILDG